MEDSGRPPISVPCAVLLPWPPVKTRNRPVVRRSPRRCSGVR